MCCPIAAYTLSRTKRDGMGRAMDEELARLARASSPEEWVQEQERRGVPLSLRVGKDIHEQIVAGAKAASRSVSAETQRLLGTALLIEKAMASGSWSFGYYVMNAVDQKKWRAPMLDLDLINQAELHGVYAADAVGIEGDWSGDPEAYRAAMLAVVRRLFQLAPDFDPRTAKTAIDNVIMSETRRRKAAKAGEDELELKSDAA